MSQTLHLGVIDVPYVAAEPPGRYRRRIAQARHGRQPVKAKAARSGEQTTGDVATILEARYGLFTHFFEHHEEDIAERLATSVSDSLDSLLAGAPVTQNPFGGFEQEVVTMFRKAIEQREFDSYGIPGVPTKAARQGVNSRMKSRRGGDRPSFRDTGLMEASFLAWMTNR